jgi:hypothetical protein
MIFPKHSKIYNHNLNLLYKEEEAHLIKMSAEMHKTMLLYNNNI